MHGAFPQKSIAGAVGVRLGNAPYKISVLLRSAFGIALKSTVSINVHGAFPKIYWWSSTTLGNATYKIAFGIALPFYVKSQITEAIPVRVALHFINLSGSSVIVMQWTGVIRDGTLI